jgi:predicted DCC family thiol-disulfide oxidoreductase YuxK/uncharacterized membrane protein YphA (DoxX/SURF4 family)
MANLQIADAGGLTLDTRTVRNGKIHVGAPRPKTRPSREERPGPLGRLAQFWFGQTDLAPVCLFRIVYGVMLFNWVWQLLPNLTPFFTDEGMLPRRSLVAFHPVRFSLLNAVGEWWQVWLFWLAGLVIAVMLTVGYRTRTACVLAFLVVVSFQWRNPLILDGSDLVFRLAPFWLIFTAAGARYSVDAAVRRVRGDALTGFGPALPVRILELQIAWIYLTTVLDKLGGTKWVDGTATYYALQLKHTFGRAHVEPLALNLDLMRVATWSTLAIELLIPLLVFLPILNRQARLVAVIFAVMLQGGIMALMNVGNFPVIMIAAMILFLPPGLVCRAIDAGRRLLPRSKVRMYYDGGCQVCRRIVAYLGAFDIYRTVTFTDFREINPREVGLRTDQLQKRIHVIDERGRITGGFTAVARAARAVPLLFPLAALAQVRGVSWLAQRVYERVAGCGMSHRSYPGRTSEIHLSPALGAVPKPLPIVPLVWPRRLGCALLMGVAVTALATALPQQLASYRTPEPFLRIVQFASLDQRWNMFAPDPMGADGWLVAPARLADGTEIDLLTGGRPSDEPRYADPFYSRYAKVFERLLDKANADYRLEYGRMHCRLRNLSLQPGQSPVVTFDLYYMQRLIQPPGKGEPVLVKHHLWSHTC